MSLGVGAYKVGGARQCSSMRRRYPWQPCERPPPNRDLLGAWKRRGQRTGVKWNLWLQQPQAPSTAVASKNRHTLTKWMQLTVRATPKHCSTIPEQFGAKRDCNVEGAVDNKWQGHAMSSQLTRDACKSFPRCADIKLVCIVSPTSKSLNQVYWRCSFSRFEVAISCFSEDFMYCLVLSLYVYFYLRVKEICISYLDLLKWKKFVY